MSAYLADACSFVTGDIGMIEIAEVRHKLAVLRGHCDAVGRDYDAIEKTLIHPWLLACDDRTVAAMRERLAARGSMRGFVGTVPDAIDPIAQYHEVGIDLLINPDRRNDVESGDLFASDVIPHFAGPTLIRPSNVALRPRTVVLRAPLARWAHRPPTPPVRPPLVRGDPPYLACDGARHLR